MNKLKNVNCRSHILQKKSSCPIYRGNFLWKHKLWEIVPFWGSSSDIPCYRTPCQICTDIPFCTIYGENSDTGPCWRRIAEKLIFHRFLVFCDVTNLLKRSKRRVSKPKGFNQSPGAETRLHTMRP